MPAVTDGVLHSFDIKEVKKHLAFGTANKGLFGLNSKEGFYNVNYAPFMAGGLRWQIYLYPYEEILEIYLNLLDNSNADIKYNYMLIVRDMNASQWNVDSKGASPSGADFQADEFGVYLGLSMVRIGSIHQTDVLKYTNDEDFMLLKLALWVVVDKATPEEPKESTESVEHEDPEQNDQTESFSDGIADPNRNVGSPLGLWVNTLLTGEFSDIQFVVKDQIFLAHRAVLAARSAVFRSEFLTLQNNMNQHSLTVSIQHMDSIAFKYLLHFIYTDSLPADIEQCTSSNIYHQLFIAAHRFKIEGLKLICSKKLTKVITDTIITTLDLIDHQECGVLKIVSNDGNMSPEAQNLSHH